MNKIISYIGFAIKSKKYVAGQTPLKHYTKPLHLVLVCSSASQNLKDLAYNIASKHGCECIITKPMLSSLTNMDDIKIFGITDLSLSEAIKNNKEIIEIG